MKKCRYEDSNGNCTYTELGGSCNDIPCCYIKQLIIKNEELKKRNDELINNNHELAYKYTFLEKENEELKNEHSKIKDNEWNAYYYASSIKTIFEGARGAIEELLKLELPKKIKYWVDIANMYLHFREETTNTKWDFDGYMEPYQDKMLSLTVKNAQYKQALEEIKKITNKYLDMSYIVSCVTPLCEIKIKIDEVLK